MPTPIEPEITTSNRAQLHDRVLAAHLVRIADGDEDALVALHTATLSRIHSIARAVLRCPHDAQEVVAEVLTHVWYHSNRYDARRGSVMGWIAVMTRHRALDSLRKRRLTVSLDDDQAGSLRDALVTDDENPEQSMVRLQASRTIRGILALQSPLKRRVIAMAFFDGLRHEDIAESTGLPLGTVKSHIRRALIQMRSMLRSNPSHASM